MDRSWPALLQLRDQRLRVRVEVVPVVPGELALLVGPHELLEADLVAAVAVDSHRGQQLFGGWSVDDDRVVAGDEVVDALSVGEPFGGVVDPAGQVVEQTVGDLGWQSGGDQFGVVVGGEPDGVGERSGGVGVVGGGQDVGDGPAGGVDDLFLALEEVAVFGTCCLLVIRAYGWSPGRVARRRRSPRVVP